MMKLPSPPSRHPGLDTLRALAIVIVMLYHLTAFGELPRRIFPVTYFGWLGVDLFFVLSGFLIGQQVLRPYCSGRRLSIPDFYRRRAFRILPAYFTVLALYFLVPEWRESPRLSPLWKFLTFTMNFGISFKQHAFSQAWSLCVEEHFYLVLPFIVVWLMRHPSPRITAALLGSIILGGIALRAFLVLHCPDSVWTDIYYPSYTRLDGLVVGVALATLRTFRPAAWRSLMSRGHSLLVLGALCVACVIWMFHHENFGSSTGLAAWGVVIGFPLLALGLGLITASSISANGLLARIKIPGAETLATLAYCLYLTHKEVGHLILTRCPRVTVSQGPSSWLLYAVSCFAAAWLLHIAVERPFLRLRDRAPRHETQSALESEMRREPAL